MSFEEDRGPLLLGVVWAEVALATLIFSARYYARITFEAQLGVDDWLMLVALVLAQATASMLSVSVHYGLGRHQQSLEAPQSTTALEYQWISQPLIVLSSVFSRISISILLVRIFPNQRAMKWFLVVLAVSNSIFALVSLMLIFTQCSPPRKLWNPDIEGWCASPVIQASLAIAKALINAASDIAMGAWPAFVIRKLQIKRSRKVFIGGLFSLTLLVTISSVVESYYLSAIQASRDDETYATPILNIWINTSHNASIIVGSLLTLGRLFRNRSPRNSHSNSGANKIPKYLTPPKRGHSRPTGLDHRNPGTVRRISSEERILHEATAIARLSPKHALNGSTAGIRKTMEIDIDFESSR